MRWSFLCGRLSRRRIFNAELSTDQITQAVFDFSVPRDGALSSISGVGVNVMLLPVPFEKTTCGLQFLNEFGALHFVSSAISFVFDPG